MFSGKSQRQRSYSFSKIGRQSLSDVERLWTFPGSPGNEGKSWMLGMFLGDKLLLFHSKHSKGHGRENDLAREYPTVDKWRHWNTRKKERAGFQEVALEEEESHLLHLTKEFVQKQNCSCSWSCVLVVSHHPCFLGMAPLGYAPQEPMEGADKTQLCPSSFARNNGFGQQTIPFSLFKLLVKNLCSSFVSTLFCEGVASLWALPVSV